MDESKPMSAQQQQKLILQQHQLQQQQLQQQQRQQQLLLLQQLQKQQQQAAMSRFPSNIDVHLRTPGLIQSRPINPSQQSSNPNPNHSPNLVQQSPNLQHQQNMSSSQQQQQKLMRPLNHMELQFSYQDAWRVCHPDFKRPFSSLEDACERLLPYHVVADYEAEEDDRILDSDTTGQTLSRSQQWDNNIAAKVAEFAATFEKQALAFNIITRKRAIGEFRSEERLMIEQALLQEERKTLFKLKAEMDQEKAGREAQEAQEAKLRMAAMAQAGQVRAELQAHAEIISHNPIRANAILNQGNNGPLSHEMEPNINLDEMVNGWGNNSQRDEKEPSEDFLNDEENENGETDEQENWREGGEFDLNCQ
ncbi:PREDICTED: putative uncharacterized protein DDB_G0271606 [Tarenaya hassleriana]|uniref:putative uncharacterized protein DDB_G0271606 n=1 Tax=Tarenaya hassleriana TaxID=28532 RepID=UPI00053C8ECA|nr:PREDICTED: putative uncharacterized protein DDB_G0271606 [Tarenaya hassleriana]